MDASMYLDIPYTTTPVPNKCLQFDLYVPPSTSPELRTLPLICFLHGGAWRSEDKSHHRALAIKLAARTGFPVAVPNYRLTPSHPTPDDSFLHPRHSEDILEFLQFLLTYPGPSGLGDPPYDPSQLFLLGHSCSAHMLASIFLDSSSITPTLSPSESVLGAVRGIIMSEGIYDIDLLLSTFPEYKDWFIENTFGPRDSYADFSTIRLSLRSDDSHIRWLIIHSKGDTLVDRAQSEAMYEHLRQITHTSDICVEKDMDVLDGDHNEILTGDDYVRIVSEFILGTSSVLAGKESS